MVWCFGSFGREMCVCIRMVWMIEIEVVLLLYGRLVWCIEFLLIIDFLNFY
jgi:hypothetical protein